MSAAERLISLQIDHPLPALDAARSGHEGAELELPEQQPIGTAPVDRVKLLLESLSPGLPQELQECVGNGQIVVGEVGLSSPRAYIEHLARDQSLIVMHSGLFEFLYRIARPLSAAVFRKAGEVDQIGIDRAELTRVICEIFWWQRQTGHNFGPGYPITEEQKRIANILAHSAELFLLAHEFGHAAIALVGDVDGGGITASEEEMLADELGLRIFMAAHAAAAAPLEPLRLSMAYAGAEFALQVWDVMSKLGLVFVDGVHPPSRVRIEELRATFCKHIDGDEVSRKLLQLPTLLEETFDEVTRIIIEGGGEYASLYERQGEQIVQAIFATLDKCASNTIPDYLTFYDEAIDLMSQGYAHEVLMHVFDRVAAEFSALRSQREDLDGAVMLQRFNRFKLLLGLTGNLPEPAKSLFNAALSKPID